jgi:uncharacterized protein (DUF608 family)
MTNGPSRPAKDVKAVSVFTKESWTFGHSFVIASLVIARGFEPSQISLCKPVRLAET